MLVANLLDLEEMFLNSIIGCLSTPVVYDNSLGHLYFLCSFLFPDLNLT